MTTDKGRWARRATQYELRVHFKIDGVERVETSGLYPSIIGNGDLIFAQTMMYWLACGRTLRYMEVYSTYHKEGVWRLKPRRSVGIDFDGLTGQFFVRNSRYMTEPACSCTGNIFPMTETFWHNPQCGIAPHELYDFLSKKGFREGSNLPWLLRNAIKLYEKGDLIGGSSAIEAGRFLQQATLVLHWMALNQYPNAIPTEEYQLPM